MTHCPTLALLEWQQVRSLLNTPLHLPLWLAVLAVAVVTGVLLVLHRQHQRALAKRAWLLNEAVHNEDYAFQLSAQGLPPGERALLDTLNRLVRETGMLMDRREVEAWKKLTRVLTHEVMNAAAPIASITQAWLAQPRVQGSPYEEGLRAIQSTTAGLTAFVESYRKMTQLQKPVLRDVSLQDMAQQLQAMYPQVKWHTRLDDAPIVPADAQLLRQTLVNIVKNALEAGATRVGLDWHSALLVSNDGQPIPSEVRGEVFVPFFTTKRTGSGIGLSFSRQITMAQGGNLSLLPVPVSGYHTTFAITFTQTEG